MTERYTFDPPKDLTLDDLADLFRLFRVEVDRKMYNEAPVHVQRLFKPSIFSSSPSKMVN